MSKLRNITGLFIALFIVGSISATAQTQVSDVELNKFADAFTQVQTENQKAKQQMVSIIEEKGLELERFNTIQQGKMDPNKTVEATDEELAKHQAIVGELQKMQPVIQGKMETIIKDSGLTLTRYQEVASALQTDKELQQELQSILMKKQTQG